MYKVYNTQQDIASNIKNFPLKVFPNIRKSQLKIIPYIVIGMIISESSVASDIAKNLKDDFSLVQIDSVIKRIRRLFKNKLFDPYSFYDFIIKYIIKNFKGTHKSNSVHIIFDHIFSHDNFTVFMISMRIGKQSIPLWFRCFKGKDCPDAFQENLLKEGISYVSSLFGNNFKLIFLADRWFNSTSLMQHIDSLGHSFCIRLKKNVKIFIYDRNEKHFIWKFIDDIRVLNNRSKLLHDILLTENKYKVNITISKSNGVSEPWIIVTNSDPKRAIKNYGYRFGGIEFLFKSQKSNGFYLENTCNASLKYFESMYSITCFSCLFLTIIGADYTKNTKCYKNVKITTHQSNKNNKIIRIMSYLMLV